MWPPNPVGAPHCFAGDIQQFRDDLLQAGIGKALGDAFLDFLNCLDDFFRVEQAILGEGVLHRMIKKGLRVALQPIFLASLFARRTQTRSRLRWNAGAWASSARTSRTSGRARSGWLR